MKSYSHKDSRGKRIHRAERIRFCAALSAGALLLVGGSGGRIPVYAAEQTAAVTAVTGEGNLFHYERKPVLSSLLKRFPKSLSVEYADGSRGTEKVTWQCTEDYEKSELHIQVFTPVFRDTDVQLRDPDSLPFMTVYIADPGYDSDDADAVYGSGDLVRIPAGTSLYGAATNEENVFIFLRREMNLNAAQAVGILTNIAAESSCNPSASGDGGTSYGICQWHNGEVLRFDNLISWCGSNGYDYTSLEGQLRYLQYEAEKDYPATMAAIRACENSADGAERAAYLWCRNYEVPANTEVTSHYRGEIARSQFYPRFQNYAVDSGADDNHHSGGKDSGNSTDTSALNLQWYRENGREYWYENGIRQGTAEDPKGVWKDGTNRGREICDPSSSAWYWLDSALGGAKATGKEVYIPYIDQNENSWSDEEKRQHAAASDPGLADYVYACMANHTGKWVRYDGNGQMLKGWVTIEGSLASLYPTQSGKTYYYDTLTGLMAKGTVTLNTAPDGSYVTRTYYFDETTGELVQ